MRTPIRILITLALLLATGAAPGAEPVYVDPRGDDRAAGTREQPLASIAAALRRVEHNAAASEIVLREGVYPGGITIAPRLDPPPLILRAETRADGSFEDAVIDGSDRIGTAHPVASRPNVFRVSLRSRGRSSHDVWEEDTRIRYRRVADLATVERVPASFVVEGDALYLHSSDGRPPDAHRIARSRDLGGIRVLRRNVTLRGLQLRHFALERQSYGIRVDVGDVTIEDCRIWNARRAIFRGPIRPTVAGVPYGADQRDLEVRRCRADDVSAGFFGQGGVSRIEHCQLFHRPGPFAPSDDSQDQSGIQSYSPATGAEVRGNLVVGFNSGIFFKSSGIDYVAERNTLVGPGGIGPGGSGYGMGRTRWPGRSLFRHNVVTGFRNPILQLGELPPEGSVFENLVSWPAAREPDRGHGVRRLAAWLERSNLIAEPRFADPSRDDYRLRPDSPGAKLGPGATPVGARGVASDAPEALLPPVTGSGVGAPGTFDRSQVLGLAPARASFVPRTGPPRSWYVDPRTGSDQPVVGTQKRPLRTLQLALDRANPGDRVVLLPGLYLGTSVLAHGGTAEAPIVIEASQAGGAVLDGLKEREGESVLTIRDAPHVVVRGLEVRWFRSPQFGPEAAGISIERSAHVEIRDCEVWNDAWTNDRAIGIGIRAHRAPGLVIDNCLVYAVDNGLVIQESPSFRITSNTVAMAVHHGVMLVDSARGSILENNSLAFSGSHLLSIRATREELASFRSDYNNLAAYLRGAPTSLRPAPGPDPGSFRSDFFRVRGSKAVGSWNQQRLESLEAWRAATGQDAHSIFRHPRYRDPGNRDFRPSPDSPNRGAGRDGGDIGARGIEPTSRGAAQGRS